MKKEMKVVAAVGLLLIQFLLGACATLFNGNRGDLQVNSHPSGAKVYVDGVEYGTTPVKLKLEEKKTHVIKLKMGSREQVINVGKKIGAKWIILDVLGGFIPIIIDAATGSWYDIEPHEVNVQMK